MVKHEAIAYGDTVMVVTRDRKTFLRTLSPGGSLQTHQGVIKYDDVVGQPYGSRTETHLGNSVWLLRPNLDDVIRHTKRESQIIYPKDLGYILLKMNIGAGSRVIEAGTGSGGLTMALASMVGPEGHVYSYDRRERMQQIARANIQRLGLSERVTFILKDIEDGFDQEGVDALFLDTPNPWEYLIQAHRALQGGGFLGSILPTMNQVIQLVDMLHSPLWFMVELEEILLRQYKTVPARIRPEDQMVGHTGYLIFARSLVGGAGLYEASPDEGKTGSGWEDERPSD